MSEDHSSSSQAFVEDARAFWRESARKIINESISSIEESAKQLVLIAGILIGLYTNAIAFADLQGEVTENSKLLLILSPLCLWLLSVGTATGVFWLRTYSINIQSSSGSKDTIERIAHRKHRFLKASFVFLLSGIALLIPVLIAYLRGNLGYT